MKALYIPWYICCTQGLSYENGVPHTRGNYIIISKEHIKNKDVNELANTLVHEKVHVYQKLYPDDVSKYLEKYNFLHSGWYRFEIYENGELFEKNKV